MKNLDVIIGSNYGDEGKGLFTAAIGDIRKSNNEESIVVRFNGGSQAGHTVELSDGFRHVYSSYGSCTHLNIPTYWSEYFVINPEAFLNESDVLRSKLDYISSIYAHPDCLVTTPYDVLFNQIIETERGINRHGSVGMGFNQTIQRDKEIKFRLKLNRDDLMSNDLSDVLDYFNQKLSKIYSEIRDFYITELSSSNLGKYIKLFLDESIYDKGINDYQKMKSIINPIDKIDLNNYHLIFEGAQGLQLDKDSDNFPHVTNSHTGIDNVLSIIKDYNLTDYNVTVNYITRSYITRHGAGKLDYETEFKYEDKTNIYNEYQGTIRYAPFNFNLIKDAIDRDKSKHSFNTNLVVTWMHLDKYKIVRLNSDKVETVSKTEFITYLNQFNSYLKTKKVIIVNTKYSDE